LSSFKIGDRAILAMSPDGQWLACQGEDWSTVSLWDLSGSKPAERSGLGSVGHVRGLVFSPDGRTLAGSGDKGRVRLWDLSNMPPRERAVLEGNYEWSGPVAFSPDGKTLATLGREQAVRLWDLRSAEPKDRAIILKGKYPGTITA